MKINNILMIGVSVSVLLLTSCGGEDVPETETPAPIVTVAQETATTVPPSATDTPQKTIESEKAAPTVETEKIVPVSPLAQNASVSPLAEPMNSPLALPDVSGGVEEYKVQEIPTPSAGKANLVGRVIAKFGDSTAYAPVMMTGVYLASIVRDENGEPVVASLDNANDPSAGTDAEGYFRFLNVPPGQYVFMVFSGFTFYVIRGEDEKQMLITVKEDEMRDLGLIKTLLPPE